MEEEAWRYLVSACSLGIGTCCCFRVSRSRQRPFLFPFLMCGVFPCFSSLSGFRTWDKRFFVLDSKALTYVLTSDTPRHQGWLAHNFSHTRNLARKARQTQVVPSSSSQSTRFDHAAIPCVCAGCRYYKNKGDKEPKGVIPLDSIISVEYMKSTWAAGSCVNNCFTTRQAHAPRPPLPTPTALRLGCRLDIVVKLRT